MKNEDTALNTIPGWSNDCAGTHLLIDLWDAQHLEDENFINEAIQRAVKAGSATLLNIFLHKFGEGGGVTGVAILAESHISIHTWPETGYAAIDVFMCGSSEPELSMKSLIEDFKPQKYQFSKNTRGAKHEMV